MDRLINVAVNGSYVVKDADFAGVQGEYNITTLRITFGEDWDGYAKSVTWLNARGENPTKIEQLTPEAGSQGRTFLCKIPLEALEIEGRCEFVIDGEAEIDDLPVRQRTAGDSLRVRYAPDSDHAGNTQAPTPTDLDQFRQAFSEIQSGISDALAGAARAEAAAGDAEVEADRAEAAAATAEGYRDDAKASVNFAGAAAAQAQAAASASSSYKDAAEAAAKRAEDAAANSGGGSGGGGSGGGGDSTAAEEAAKRAESSAAEAAKSAEDAEESAQRIENMTVTGEEYDPGWPPLYNPTTVEKTVNEDGSINLHFYVPQGPRGVPGEPGLAYVPKINASTGMITWEYKTEGWRPEEIPSHKVIPQRGTDYWTEADKQQIIDEVLDRVSEEGLLPEAEGVEF